jgi:CRISPR-associated endonuclease Cas3-HD
MEIYAYYDPPFIQTLRDHVEKALETFPHGSKFLNTGFKISSNFPTLLYLAIIFHDFGKVSFNTARIEEILKGKKISFEGHEIISGWLVYKLLIGEASNRFVEAIKIPFGERESGAVVMSILLHHHPMDIVDRMKLLEKGVNLRVSESEIKAFVYNLGDIFEKYLGLRSHDLMEIMLKVVENKEINVAKICNETREIFSQLARSVWVGDSSVRRLFLYLLQGLVASDYYSSRGRREGGVSTFASAIDTFVALYGSKLG